jgi:hypothetical protein
VEAVVAEIRQIAMRYRPVVEPRVRPAVVANHPGGGTPRETGAAISKIAWVGR